jgi:hypothetical protein
LHRDVPKIRRQTAAVVNAPALDENIVSHDRTSLGYCCGAYRDG